MLLLSGSGLHGGYSLLKWTRGCGREYIASVTTPLRERVRGETITWLQEVFDGSCGWTNL